MKLFIESYPLGTDELKDYFDFINNFNAKEEMKEDINLANTYTKYVHSINFNKDLTMSEILKIKDLLYNNDNLTSSWIKNENKGIILFNKDNE